MHFKSFSESVQISGEAILSTLKALEEYSISINELLNNHQLTDIKAGQWYDFQKWLNVLSEVSVKYGPNTIFTLGKGIVNNIPDLKLDFRSLLSTINEGYKRNHIGGDAGFIELVSFDNEKKEARFKSYTPYPAVYGRGVLVGMIRKFKPVPGSVPKVEIETTEDESLSFLIVTW